MRRFRIRECEHACYDVFVFVPPTRAHKSPSAEGPDGILFGVGVRPAAQTHPTTTHQRAKHVTLKSVFRALSAHFGSQITSDRVPVSMYVNVCLVLCRVMCAFVCVIVWM